MLGRRRRCRGERGCWRWSWKAHERRCTRTLGIAVRDLGAVHATRAPTVNGHIAFGFLHAIGAPDAANIGANSFRQTGRRRSTITIPGGVAACVDGRWSPRNRPHLRRLKSGSRCGPEDRSRLRRPGLMVSRPRSGGLSMAIGIFSNHQAAEPRPIIKEAVPCRRGLIARNETPLRFSAWMAKRRRRRMFVPLPTTPVAIQSAATRHASSGR